MTDPVGAGGGGSKVATSPAAQVTTIMAPITRAKPIEATNVILLFLTMRSSQDPESFTQQRSPDPLPARGPMHKRHGASQLEVRDRLIEAHALGGILPGARLVRSLEAVGERIEPSQRTKMAQTQKPKMSRKMGHVEQGVILAKFVEVQTG